MNAKEFTKKLFGNSDSKKWGDDLKESRERASFIVNTLSKELGKRDWNLVMDLYVDMDIFSDVPEHEAHALIDQSPYPINLKNMLHELFIFYSDQKKKITGEKDLAQYLSYMFDAY